MMKGAFGHLTSAPLKILALAYLSHILSGKQGNRDVTLVEDLIVAPPYLLQPVIELPWRSSDSDPLLPDSSIESEPPIVFGCQIKLVSASNQRDLSNLNLGGALDLILECSHGGYGISCLNISEPQLSWPLFVLVLLVQWYTVTEKGNRSGNKTMMTIFGANKVVQCNSISIAAWLGNWYMTLWQPLWCSFDAQFRNCLQLYDESLSEKRRNTEPHFVYPFNYFNILVVCTEFVW
ncbi:hypothetical protein LIER_40222 [Lithospermum erythrorhizon]|uniref:Uncharacterized protein n=1 Tax=Lithospermum erythrorhizon TaxID=34254 RepID=A0AAV3QR95_LITER